MYAYLIHLGDLQTWMVFIVNGKIYNEKSM